MACSRKGRAPDRRRGGTGEVPGRFDRRTFLKAAAGVTLAAAGGAVAERLETMGLLRTAQAAAAPAVAVAKDREPEALVRSAVAALGGMSSFVGRGDVVVVKPNIGWDREPAQAADTNPEVVRTVVKLCLEAGAKTVKVMDRPCNDPRRCYKRSGIKDAVESLNDPAAVIEFMDDRKFLPRSIPGGKLLTNWTFYQDVLEADKRINVPIAKHHNAARLTMGLKNVMGCLGGNRGNIHHELDRYLADLNTFLKFDLVILDAVRILTNNGPQGGRLQDVRKIDTVAAGSDPVAVDSFGATLFGITGHDVLHVRYASEYGLGEIDLSKVRLLKA